MCCPANGVMQKVTLNNCGNEFLMKYKMTSIIFFKIEDRISVSVSNVEKVHVKNKTLVILI